MTVWCLFFLHSPLYFLYTVSLIIFLFIFSSTFLVLIITILPASSCNSCDYVGRCVASYSISCILHCNFFVNCSFSSFSFLFVYCTFNVPSIIRLPASSYNSSICCDGVCLFTISLVHFLFYLFLVRFYASSYSHLLQQVALLRQSAAAFFSSFSLFLHIVYIGLFIMLCFLFIYPIL